MSPSPWLVLSALVTLACTRTTAPGDAPPPPIDRAVAPVVDATVDLPPTRDVVIVASDVVTVASDVAVADARVDAPRPPPAYAGASCDDRVGCGRRLVCCTHGGIAMSRTHRGTCMTYRGCNTQPAAARGAR